jgi:hypothetical protein
MGAVDIPSPHAVPVWVITGAVGRFYLRVDVQHLIPIMGTNDRAFIIRLFIDGDDEAIVGRIPTSPGHTRNLAGLIFQVEVGP